MPYIIKRTVDPQKPMYLTQDLGRAATLNPKEEKALQFKTKAIAEAIGKFHFGERQFNEWWEVIKVKAPEGANS